MKRELYSELRTLYETTAADPHTFRLTIKLKDLIDGDLLRAAVGRTMRRYPYFRVRLSTMDGEPCFEDNPAPVPVIHSNQRVVLGSEQTAGHLLCFCYWKNRLHIDAYHGLTDGGGIYHLIKSLLYYYCSAFYEIGLSADGICLSDDPVRQEEWDDPAAVRLEGGKRGLASKWHQPALQLEDAGIVRLVPDGSVITLRIPEAAFMRFNMSNDGSPATIVALLLARAIDALHPGAELPPVIAMCVNQRKALRAPYAHQSLVGDVRLPYAGRIRGLDFSTQATCFRGMVTLQSDADMVLDDIRDYQALVDQLRAMDDPQERRDCCVRGMEALSKCVTATVSYVGKASLGEAEYFIQEFDALPSTALPSTHVPLTVEMSAVNGYFFLNFIQYFHEEDYFKTFVSQLRKNNIDYDVLDVTEARYPSVEIALGE